MVNIKAKPVNGKTIHYVDCFICARPGIESENVIEVIAWLEANKWQSLGCERSRCAECSGVKSEPVEQEKQKKAS